MKKIRSLISRWYVMIPMCLAFITYSCQTSEEVALPNIGEVSGQDIFTGIFFGEGVVAEEITFFNNTMGNLKKILTAVEYKDFKSYQNKLINSMEVRHTGIFHQFKADMTSGNHRRISEGLNEMSEKVIDIIMEDNKEIEKEAGNLVANLDKVDQDKLYAAIQDGDRAGIEKIVGVLQASASENGKNSGVQACTFLVLVCAFTVVLAATIAIAVTGAIALALYFAAGLVQTIEIGAKVNLNNLHQEELVNTIAVHLAI